MLQLSFFYMALTINIMDGHGLSNKAHYKCLPKETKSCAIRYSFFLKRGIQILYISSKVEHFSYNGKWVYM